MAALKATEVANMPLVGTNWPLTGTVPTEAPSELPKSSLMLTAVKPLEGGGAAEPAVKAATLAASEQNTEPTLTKLVPSPNLMPGRTSLKEGPSGTIPASSLKA